MIRVLFRFAWTTQRTVGVFLLAGLIVTAAHAAPRDAWARGSDATFNRAFPSEPGALDIAQDADGFLWIATQSGLQRWKATGCAATPATLPCAVRCLTAIS